jgi:competence protein ComEA
VKLITIKKYLQKTTGLDRFLIAIVLFGVVVSAISIFRGILMDRQVQVEYLSGGNASGLAATKLVVDVEGAVINPGVYELAGGSRMKDVLVTSGGLSADADRDYCEKTLNMAEEVKDGQKIYIPKKANDDTLAGYPEANNVAKKVNVNTASMAELDTLWGVGSARADSIVKNRPYQSLDELVSKKVLTQTILDRDKDLLSVY